MIEIPEDAPQPTETPAPFFPQAVQNLKHTLYWFKDEPDDWMILMATSSLYDEGVQTGLCLGDLRRLGEGLGIKL